MNILFPGRFQPIHKGHVHTFNELSKKGKVHIAVIRGAVTSRNLKLNPFSEDQQLDLIQDALPDAEPIIFANGYLPDILEWYKEHGIKIDAIACGSDRINTYAAQLARGGVSDVVIYPVKRLGSATEVRRHLAEDNRLLFQASMPESLHGWYKILKRTVDQPDGDIE
ncbi:ADP ribosyltransferase [Stenotrophomonas phage Marzo]|nr:ADP ribosyltransferase [Stenotrophomonas phage Marzo]